MAAFKGNGGNMQNLMRQAQKMQEEMEKTAEMLDDWEIVGSAAGEAVVVYMNAKDHQRHRAGRELRRSDGRGNAGGPHYGGHQRRLLEGG